MAATKYKQVLPKTINRTTPNPMNRTNALRHPDSNLWPISLDGELDKIDETGTIKRLNKGELGILPKNIKPIPLTITSNYKTNKSGEVEKRKSRPSLRGDMMMAHLHFNPIETSAPIVDRVAVRILITHSIENGWPIEHFDI